MKTKALLSKYKKILGALSGVGEENISVWVRPDKDKAFEEIGEELDPEKKEYIRDWCLGEYEVRLIKDNITLAGFKLYQLPHCCGVMVSCNAYVSLDYRNRRIGTVMNDLRQELGRGLGYSLILCTDKAKNTYQKQLLKTNGWNVIQVFKNKRTDNILEITTKVL